MSAESLTLAEAVSLGTVHLQRILERAGVRSLVVKGPAFAELGVRTRRRSNDIDLLIHQDDRTAATEALADAGWLVISHWFPPALDDVIYSTTFRHPLFPSTLDLHHRFSGLFAGAAAFDVLWEQRTRVTLARVPVTTVGRDHALIIEALNATKLLPEERRGNAARRVVAAAAEFGVSEVEAAAETVGARHTAAPLIEALGGGPTTTEPPAAHADWVGRGARNSGLDLAKDLITRAPGHIPRVVWQQLTLDPDIARFWAHTHGVTYRNRWQILWLRIRRMVRRSPSVS